MKRLLVVSCLCLMHATGVDAQVPDEPPPRYLELIDSALTESAAGRWGEARALFHQAHELYPNARTLRGIGVVSFEMREYADTVRYLRSALAEPRRALDDVQRAEAEQTLQRAFSFLARYDVSAAPRDIEWSIDGKRVTVESDGMLLIPLGEHTISVVRGEQRGSAVVKVRGGEQVVFPVELQDPAPAQEPTAPAPVDAHVGAPASEPAKPMQPFPWTSTILTATGGAMLIAGVALLVAGMADVSKVEDAPANTPWTDLEAANDRAPLLTGVGIGLMAAGGVVGTIGVVGLTLGDDDRDGATDSGRIMVRGWF